MAVKSGGLMIEEGFTFVIPETELLSRICGSNDSNLHLIEKALGLTVYTKGNEISVELNENAVPDALEKFRFVLERIMDEASEGEIPCADMINAILNIEKKDKSMEDEIEGIKENFHANSIRIPGGIKTVFPKTLHQAQMINSMRQKDMVFAVGPAGSGKTYLAVAQALCMLLERKCKKIVLTRPVVEAGESLGFLPGDFEQKINPYLRPLYDAMEDLLSREVLRKLTESAIIEIAPLAYMRGRTLGNCVVILDEAQNTTGEQMKMFLTRLGEGSKAFITGDITQIDLPKRIKSGLVEAVEILKDIDEIAIHHFEGVDVVRNPLVKKIIQAYENAKEE